MKTKVFIDGHEGTTGLRIHERLSTRQDIELVPIADDVRKDPDAIRACMKQADIAFLCLPDGAAAEAVTLAEGCDVRLIDTSTGRRVAPGWTYGFPELSPQQAAAIAKSDRVAIRLPCQRRHFHFTAPDRSRHRSGRLSGDGLFPDRVQRRRQEDDRPVRRRQRAGFICTAPVRLVQQHKHLPEIVTICHLTQEPVFTPIVDDYYSGMEVMIPFFSHLLAKKVTAHDVWQVLASHYDGCPFVHVLPFGEDKGGFIAANDMSGYDDMEILVTGNDQRIMVTSLFDNLGKGASGAAIQNMNLMMGIDPTTG